MRSIRAGAREASGIRKTSFEERNIFVYVSTGGAPSDAVTRSLAGARAFMVRMRAVVRIWMRAPHYKPHFEKSATIMQQPAKMGKLDSI